MRRTPPIVALLLLVASLAGASSGQPALAAAAPSPRARFIVVFNDDVAAPGVLASTLAVGEGAVIHQVFRLGVTGYAATMSLSAAASLRADPRVAYVVPDGKISAPAAEAAPNAATTQFVSSSVRRIEGTTSSAASGDGAGEVPINIAVLDSGVQPHHPDLNVAGSVDCTGHNRPTDVFGHGTFVAGVIGAKDNDFGTVGIVPGARIWSVRVLNHANAGDDSWLLCAIEWVTATRTDADPTNDIAVANMSLGGPGADDHHCGQVNHDPIHQAICASVAAGVTYVAAAGNAAEDFNRSFPANYDEVLTATGMADDDGQPGGLGPNLDYGACTAGGTQRDDAPAGFSNFTHTKGDRDHMVAAPSVCIRSTYKDSQYAVWSGTSFASPLVSGTVALCIFYGPCTNETPQQIVHRVVRDTQSFNRRHHAYGFRGDPLHNPTHRYYGYLIHAGSY